MISKVIMGKTFYGACKYICGDTQRAAVLEAEGVRDYDYREMAKDFEAQRSVRRGISKPVFHGILSFYPGEKLSDGTMLRIAKEYLQELGIKDTQFVITKHTDKSHLHLHILANLVNNKGVAIRDSYIGLKSKKAAEKLTKQYGLNQVKGKDLTKTNIENLNERESTRYQIYQAITQRLPHCKTLDELKEDLQKEGIETLYKYKSGTDELQGIIFKLGDYKFKGSEVDRSYSLGKLQKTINHQLKEKEQLQVYAGSSTSQNISHLSQKKSAETLYREIRNKDLLNQLLKPEQQSEMQPQNFLLKKRKKKKKGPHL